MYGVVRLNTEDDYRDFYRTFEMTSFDKLKQMAALDTKTISVQAVNQEAALGPFLKLFKSVPGVLFNA